MTTGVFLEMPRRLLLLIRFVIILTLALMLPSAVYLVNVGEGWTGIGIFALAVADAVGLLWFTYAASRQQPELTLEDKVDHLRWALKSSRELIREVNAEFDLQLASANKIKAEAEQNQRLADLNAEQARAVTELVESVQSKASKLGGRQQWMFFLAGLVASVPLGVIGNFVFELVKVWLAS